MLKKLSILTASTAMLLSTAGVALAHVVVQPDEVGVAKTEDFSVGVPNEKEIPTTQVRLVLPEGLESVTPFEKAGWRIETKKTGEGDSAKVTEITWKNGSIGVGLRDNFVFRAKAPADETTLVWKAYQTYLDGSVVSWDQKADENMTEEEEAAMEEKGLGPSSETKIVNDLSSDSADSSGTDKTTQYVAYAALVAGVIGIALNFRKK